MGPDTTKVGPMSRSPSVPPDEGDASQDLKGSSHWNQNIGENEYHKTVGPENKYVTANDNGDDSTPKSVTSSQKKRGIERSPTVGPEMDLDELVDVHR